MYHPAMIIMAMSTWMQMHPENILLISAETA